MVALLLGTMAGCKGKTSGNNKLNDSLATEIGEMVGTGLKAQMSQMPNIDDQLDKEMFLKGLETAIKSDTTKRTASYNQGFMTGMQIYQQMLAKYDMMGVKIDRRLLIEELRKHFLSKDSIDFTNPMFQQKMQALQNSLMAHDTRITELKGKEMIAEGKKYIADQMKKDKGFKKTKSGVAYKIIQPGNGANFTDTSTVELIYEGKHLNGKVFDSSKGEARPMNLMMAVPGFREVVKLMKPGAKAIAIIPGDQAYGMDGARAGFAPYEALIFEITTVKEAPKAAQPPMPGLPAGAQPGKPAVKPAPKAAQPAAKPVQAPAKQAPVKQVPVKQAPAKQAPLPAKTK